MPGKKLFNFSNRIASRWDFLYKHASFDERLLNTGVSQISIHRKSRCCEPEARRRDRKFSSTHAYESLINFLRLGPAKTHMKLAPDAECLYSS
jgi:hypothetical protein